MANKKKITTSIVAGVTAVALVLGGTFAWTSISQQAQNEAAGIVNVGGRLHDDFNGTNKDVYVENFTDPLNGGQPIYARVMLTEYMEVGQDAGGTDDGDGVTEVAPVIEGALFDDETTWKPFVPGSITETAITCADCDEANGLCTIHNHWKWTVGGSTVFMPTFNKDKDSLQADINGTYHGTDDTDKIYYDDYETYFEGQTVDGTAYYDDDTDTEENTSEGQYRTAEETHTAKQTATATIMTMQEWIDSGSQPGNYWVYDTDGWAYWANPIMPGESTGLLLDGIEMFKNPGEKCYYSINVVGQFATVGDWEKFYTNAEGEGTISESARKVMEAAAANVPTVTISGPDYVATGENYTFSATASRAGVAPAAEGAYTWTVADKNGNAVESSIASIIDGTSGATLSIGANIPNGTELIVAARCTDESYLGTTGVKRVVVTNDVALIPVVTILTNFDDIANIRAINLNGTLTYNTHVYDSSYLTWSMTDADGNAVSAEVAVIEGNDLIVKQYTGMLNLKLTAMAEIEGKTAQAEQEISIDTDDYCNACGAVYNADGVCSTGCAPLVNITANASNITNIKDGVRLNTTVTVKGEAAEGDINWSIADKDGNPVENTVAYIENGVLKFAQTDGLLSLKITATVTINGETGSDTEELSINLSDYCASCGVKYNNGFCNNSSCENEYQPAVANASGVYQIANGGNMYWLAEHVNAGNERSPAVLTKDINLEGSATMQNSRRFIPIGTSSSPYWAEFDGAGHSISNLNISTNKGETGLFGYVTDSTIKNFAISGDIYINAVSSEQKGFGVIGISQGATTITDIHSELNISETNTTATGKVSYLGGILGGQSSLGVLGLTVERCSYTGSIIFDEVMSKDAYFECVGGIVGYVYIDASVSLKSNLFAGMIDAKVPDTLYVGGILGYKNVANGSLTVRNCLTYGSITTDGSCYTSEDGMAYYSSGAIIGRLKGRDVGAYEDNFEVLSCVYCLINCSEDIIGSIGGMNTNGSDPDTVSTVISVDEFIANDVCDRLTDTEFTCWHTVDGLYYPVPNNLAK